MKNLKFYSYYLLSERIKQSIAEMRNSFLLSLLFYVIQSLFSKPITTATNVSATPAASNTTTTITSSTTMLLLLLEVEGRQIKMTCNYVKGFFLEYIAKLLKYTS